MENTEIFKRQWESFRVGLKGALLKKSRNHTLTFAMAKLMLEDAKADWLSPSAMSGRWLKEFTAANPKKGALVRNIIEKDMTFNEVKSMKNIPMGLDIGLSAAGALIGFGISRFAGAGTVVSVLSTVLPPIAIYPSINAAKNVVSEKNETQSVEDYMSQLDKYYKSILSILEQDS